MTDQEQIIALAEWDGWTIKSHNHLGVYGSKEHSSGGRTGWVVPDYLSDLNAVHELEKKLLASQHDAYMWHLTDSVRHESEMGFVEIHATARQRCEALLRTIGKWKD